MSDDLTHRPALTSAGGPATQDPAPNRTVVLARSALRLFSAFRRTRPFWGGLWLLVGGWLVLRLSLVSVHIVIVSGVTGLGGWLAGGGMIACGAAAWAAPSQRYVVGIVGLLLAVSSLIISNLGGLFVGMLFGIVGGSMTVAWGPKRARRPRRAGTPPAADPAVGSPARPRPGPRPSPESAAPHTSA